ncbi:MAG: coproporphyrinogen III oxidase, partial [Reichenbachiella sp.]|uniref:coproporphyrinogen III oxidase n=1 Tax=Reichenbachiella sp. TaxID=2184521 RepID=UPI003298F8C9
MNKEEIQEWFKYLQDDICNSLEKTDGQGQFKEDLWDRPEGGGGRTRVIIGGTIIEKGGVNFSAVNGPTPTKILEALHIDKADFFATGVSIVMHPHSPMVPIIHMNVRYFVMS